MRRSRSAPRRAATRWLPLLFLLLLTTTPLTGQQRLTVFAAASLSDAFQRLGTTFERDHPGVRVELNLAGSQQLALQLMLGARADVFASADLRWMQAVRDSALVDGEPLIFARNRLVVLLPRANPAHLAGLADLARPGVKLVVAAQAVPVGRYTRELLDRLAGSPGFPADFRARVEANVVSLEENVKAVVAKVALGEADAGVVYGSDVTPDLRPRTRRIEIPARYNVTAEYPVAVLRGSRHPDLARAFVALLGSAVGDSALSRAGFLPPESGR